MCNSEIRIINKKKKSKYEFCHKCNKINHP